MMGKRRRRRYKNWLPCYWVKPGYEGTPIYYYDDLEWQYYPYTSEYFGVISFILN